MKIGIVFGAFDLLHAGHIHLLKKARERCDQLIVGIHVDPSIERPEKNKPIESLFERTIKLKGCIYVDQIFGYEREEEIAIALKYFDVGVRFLGSDYEDGSKEITDRDAVLIEYIDSLPIHTSDIRKRI